MKKREMKMSMWVQHIKDKIGSMAKEKRILKCSKEEMIVGKMLQFFTGYSTEIYFQAVLSSMIQKGLVEHAPFLHFSEFFYLFQSFERLMLFFKYCLYTCLLYTSPSPRDGLLSRMPSSA
eukprot:TRINITY_DN2727_c0_g1_i15.p1 TRINITY_DN2727_c0_g1~~TRINITY_DN2727_c0_g1_i15.p1  ORF type:complete len:120 (+),score=14.30 TRINITY_DN2727_c0_g1_i15:467-826(+)